MTSLLPPAPPPSGTNAPEMSVTEIARRVKRVVEDGFGYVRVRGEIGACKLHASGHLYLSLKDENAVLEAVCWRGTVSKLGLRPATGLDVVCAGKITTYAGQSKYQMVIESMALAGEGALLKMLEDRKKKLAAEGLFDPARKRPLPFLPQVIGVITSPTGAVIRDILHRLEDRFPRHVLLWPVAVQGDASAAQIAAAIQGFNALSPEKTTTGSPPRPDLLIVARGGGSLEDLMPFNEEIVVRAVAASRIPVISAVGHETDTTLIDYAADYRAPTPTGAAEKAVPVRADLLAQVLDDGKRLEIAMRRALHDKRDRVSLVSRALGDPLRLLEPLMQRVDERAERLYLAVRSLGQRDKARLQQAAAQLRHPRDILRFANERLQNSLQRLESKTKEKLAQADKKYERLAAMLDVLSPRAVLGRGYALIHDKNNNIITSIKDLTPKTSITIELADGQKTAHIEA